VLSQGGAVKGRWWSGAALLAALLPGDASRSTATGGEVRWRLDAFPSVDALSYPTAEGQEELLLFREPGRLARYPLTVPRGYRLRQLGPGAPVELLDPQGRARSRMSAPVAWDAAGQQGRPTLEIQGNELVVGPPPGAAFPVLVDPLLSQAGSMNVARLGHTATVLGDGRVLLAGGQKIEGEAPDAEQSEVFDPWVNTFTLGAKLKHARHRHGAVLRSDGRVVLLGGLAAGVPPEMPAEGWPASPPAEVFDPGAGGAFEALGPAPDLGFAVGPVVALPQDRALVFGGAPGEVKARVASHAYRVDLATGAYEVAGELPTRRRCFGAALLEDGRVLLVGGEDDASKALDSAELLDPATGVTTPTGSLPEPRSGCWDAEVGPLDTAMMPGGKVAVAGTSKGLEHLWIYDPGPGQFIGAQDPFQGILSPGGNVLLARGMTLTWHHTKGFLKSLACAPLLGAPGVACTEPLGSGIFDDLVQISRSRPTLTPLPTGAALLVGGSTSKIAQIYSERSVPAGGNDVLYTDESVFSPELFNQYGVEFLFDKWAGSEADGVLVESSPFASCSLLAFDVSPGVLRWLGPRSSSCSSDDSDALLVQASGGEFLHFNAKKTSTSFSKISLSQGELGGGKKIGTLDLAFLSFEQTFDQNDGLLAFITTNFVFEGQLNNIVRYDPSTPALQIVPLGAFAVAGRHDGTALPLGDQKLLVVGGSTELPDGLQAPLTAEMVDLSTGTATLLPRASAYSEAIL